MEVQDQSIGSRLEDLCRDVLAALEQTREKGLIDQDQYMAMVRCKKCFLERNICLENLA